GANPAECDGPNGDDTKICHVPEGNPSARHTICVGRSGAINGHGVNFGTGAPGGHGGDTPGDC
ncbi:MAG TPA: hypothetical protein VM598_10850, partial [Bdellovibrionota bacterium]|nr:hypothetical protein [Bdellovibrionota bacterium]